jgi:hypothetical protein
MKLSELVAYRNLLATKEFDPEHEVITQRLEHIMYTVTNHPVQFPICNIDLGLRAKNIKKSLKDFRGELETLKNEINTQILRLEKSYYQRSLQWFEQESVNETADYVLNRRMSITDHDRELLTSRLRTISDWRFPAMIIHPGLEDFIQIMVAADPLYIVDRGQSLWQPTMNNFSDAYQNRVRTYVIDDKAGDTIFKRLPDSQFGFIFAFNYFNFLPMQLIERYLKEIMGLLRSGGSVLFTYNDCDREESVGSVENNFMCYTPGSRVKQVAQELGYELVTDHHGQNGVAWLEFRKPGKLTSRRGAQVLAKLYRI